MDYLYIGFSTDRKNFISKTIRYFTGSDISHSFLVTGNFLDKMSLFASNEFINNIYFLDEYSNSKDVLYRIYKMPCNNADDIIKEIVGSLNGKSYGWFQLIWFVWRWIKEKVGIKLKATDKNWFRGGTICSELVYKTLEKSKYFGKLYNVLPHLNSDTVNADDIEKVILSISECSLVESKQYDSNHVTHKEWR